MKRKITVFAIILLCLAIVSGGTIAYFTYEDTAKNVITTGNIKIELQEYSVYEDGETVLSEGCPVMPGETVIKTVSVKNIGDNPAYVRIKLDIDRIPGELDINEEEWTYSEGFYYYNEQLMPDKTTTPLFTSIHFDENMGNEWMNKTLELNIVAYATQSENNGNDPFSAMGWSSAED